jgi:alkanesulfonate monooxygenase SsuD/methylene tetrahydromethanopterin reductase-like flavin-dependent oxidoreductase (luciferase family)
VKLGLFMMPMHPPERPHADAYELDIETLVAADRLGYDEAWVGEHFTSGWENIPAPDLILAAALQRTQRIRLGTGVACLPNHNPVVLAHRIAQLDQMARGRFNFGIGSGGFPGDFQLFQLDLASGEHRTLTREIIDLTLAIGQAARAGETMPDEDITIDWLMDNIWLVGSPDDVARRIRELHAQVGGFGTVLQLIYDWGEGEECNRRNMGLLAKEVIPQLADLS